MAELQEQVVEHLWGAVTAQSAPAYVLVAVPSGACESGGWRRIGGGGGA